MDYCSEDQDDAGIWIVGTKVLNMHYRHQGKLEMQIRWECWNPVAGMMYRILEPGCHIESKTTQVRWECWNMGVNQQKA